MSYIWHLLFLLKLLLSFSIILNYKKINGEPLSPRSIKTKYGIIRGVLRYYNRQNVQDLPSPLYHIPERFGVEIFRSVPFAQPPISNLRFLPPVTQSRWRGTKLANRFLPVCMQNTAEIASSDLLSQQLPSSFVNTHFNKDKIHEFVSRSTLSSASNLSSLFLSPELSSLKTSYEAPNVSTTLLTSASTSKFLTSNKNKINLKRIKREGTFSSPIKSTSSSKLNSTLLDRARSTDEVHHDFNDQFDKQNSMSFISNSLKIHPSYFQPFAPYLRNQNEDCLNLNLYVPYNENRNLNEQYPVIVFVHGESYDWGTGNVYDGSILAGIGKIIVVTLNYRLGVFGFMPSLIEGSIRTNHGVLDVVASLHWIQDNIFQFGGSPINITLIGHQRGAALVQFLMKSQLSKGLFKRAVLLSGSSLSNWALAQELEFYTRKLASKVDCGLEIKSMPQDNLLKNLNTFSNEMITDLFRSNKFLNQTVINNHPLSSSDESIFECLRSRSSEELKIASIRLTSAFYSPFHSLFGPTIDSLLINDDQPVSNNYNNHFNHSNLNKISKFATTNSDHDLLIGFSLNSPRLRPALKQMFHKITQLPKNNSLHFFYKFLRDFVRFVNSLVLEEGSISEQNDFNELFILNNEPSYASDPIDLKNDHNLNSNHNSSNWLWKRQNDLLNIISTLLLEILILAPLFSAANSHHPGSVYMFLLPFEQGEDEFSDQELAALFGSSLAGYYFNVTDGLGRFKTNKKNLKQVQQSQNEQWKIKQPGTGRLKRWLKLVNILDEEQDTAKDGSFGKLSKKLTNELNLSKNMPYELRRGQLETVLDQLLKILDIKIKNLERSEQVLLMQQHPKSKAFNLSQVNRSNEESGDRSLNDPGGGHLNFQINRKIQISDLRKNGNYYQNNSSKILTGNLARIKDNSLFNKFDFTNQTADKGKFLNQLFSSLNLNSLNSNLEGSEKNKLSYANAIVAIIGAGLAMLLVNIFVLFLGYKCIQRRRILKQNDQISKENLNSKESLPNSIPGQPNQICNSTTNSNALNNMNYNLNLQNNNLINNSVENSRTIDKCYCGSQFCNCSNEPMDKLQLINSDSSFFTTDTIITDHLVSPVCKLINAENYDSPDMIKVNLQSSPSINDQLMSFKRTNFNKQYSSFTDRNIITANMKNSLSNNQLPKNDESNLQNCDCLNNNSNNLLATNTPMLAVLAESTSDSNLLTEFSTIGCESNLYKFFESNYYASFDPTINPNTSSLQAANNTLQSHSNSYQATLQSTMPNTLTLYGANPSTVSEQQQSTQLHPQLQAHAPQTIQLQLLTDHNFINTPQSQQTVTNNN